MQCVAADIGLTRVPEAEKFMKAAVDLKTTNDLSDILLFLTHPRTVALGLRDSRVEWPKDLLVSPARLSQEGISLTRSVRGGGITYHWEGQVVCYPILTLRPHERDISSYMIKLEQVGMESLRRFGVLAHRRRDSSAHLGLWFDGRKIVSMGIRVANWVTSFGFAMNLGGDYHESSYVRPCGLRGVGLITLQDIIGKAPLRSQIIHAVKDSFASVFGRKLENSSPQFFGLLDSLRNSVTAVC
jgi:lipoate-protein ligase B